MRVLSRLFHRLFLEQLQAALDGRQLRFFNALEALQNPATALDYRDRYQQLTGKSPRDCPKCGHGL